jgi:hypothetical protein
MRPTSSSWRACTRSIRVPLALPFLFGPGVFQEPTDDQRPDHAQETAE